jgi:ribosomal protein S18 acetylase RimI-like enzyme
VSIIAQSGEKKRITMLANDQRSPITVDRLQSYMRRAVALHRDVVHVAPFSIYFHRSDNNLFFNYAIPDEPAGAYLHEPLAALRAEFAAHERTPRFEFVEQFAPDLPAALRANGFREESRLHLMVCTPETLQPAPAAAGVSIVTLDPSSPLDIVRENMDTNNRGFNPEAEAIDEPAAEAFRARLGDARAFTAYLDGRAVGAGMYTTPLDGLTELVGIATLEEYRRRGVAGALTAHATRNAFERGVEAVFLSAADERAGRVYERVGFRPFTTMLAYIDEASA